MLLKFLKISKKLFSKSFFDGVRGRAPQERIIIKYGFIGGACGYCDGSLYFSGDLRHHPDGDRIESFCKGLGVDAVSLSDEPLKDVGSIFFFKIKP